jgi:pSer/pThr/pTyr-binding forkhead associated (FHA) protein
MTARNPILVVQENGRFHTYNLKEPYYTIGRVRSADISLPSGGVSRQHAALMKIQNGIGQTTYRLVDGNSKTQQPSFNGTTVNGARITFKDLEHDDLIVFGRSVAANFLVADASTLDDGVSEETILKAKIELTDLQKKLYPYNDQFPTQEIPRS